MSDRRFLRGLGMFAIAAFIAAPLWAQPPAAPAAPDAAPAAKTRPAPEPAARPLAGVRPLRNLEYARPDGKPVKLDLYLPEKSEPGGKPLPVVIWVHGGGWEAGSKAFCPALPLVNEGFAVASVEYRLTDRACFPAQIHDCKAAVRYLRAHAQEYKLDPERFGCWGASAGGHLVALLGTTCGNKECEGAELGNAEQSSAVQCVCDWFGPTDFTEFKSPSSDVAPMLVKLFGGKMSEKQELVKLASPALHVRKDAKPAMPPFLIVQGDKDPLVPWEQSQELADKLKEAGMEAELVIVKGGGHGNSAQGPTELRRVKDFFVQKLKGEQKQDVKPAEGAPAKAG